MKNILTLVLGLVIASNGAAASKKNKKKVYVKPYIKKDGTYIKPHYRTKPNKTKRDNWSTKGNVNPYTGKAGTKSPW